MLRISRNYCGEGCQNWAFLLPGYDRYAFIWKLQPIKCGMFNCNMCRFHLVEPARLPLARLALSAPGERWHAVSHGLVSHRHRRELVWAPRAVKRSVSNVFKWPFFVSFLLVYYGTGSQNPSFYVTRFMRCQQLSTPSGMGLSTKKKETYSLIN